MGLQLEAHLVFEKYWEAFITCSFASALSTRRCQTHLRSHKLSCASFVVPERARGARIDGEGGNGHI